MEDVGDQSALRGLVAAAVAEKAGLDAKPSASRRKLERAEAARARAMVAGMAPAPAKEATDLRVRRASLPRRRSRPRALEAPSIRPPGRSASQRAA